MISPEYIVDLKTVIMSAVLAWGATEIIKPLIKQGAKRKSLVRFIALIAGVVTGRLIYPELGGQGGAVVGGALGGASGALNTIIVALIKKRIKAESDNAK